jgi:hypothetical protein
MLIAILVPYAFITGLLATIVSDASIGHLYIDHEVTAGAVIFTIIALLSIFAYFGFRSRIPLASLLLQVVMDVSKHHKSVYVVAFIALILQAALSV